MRVLVIGATGQLGSDLCRVFADATLLRAARKDAEITLDLADPIGLRKCIVDELRPELVVNTAAFHNVAACEEAPQEAFAVNAVGVRALAEATRSAGARLVHVSTDYVFGDGGNRPWRETDLPAPLNVYGTSKLAGEHSIAALEGDYAIVRSSGLYGRTPCLAKGGENFVQLMCRLATERDQVKVVTDEVLTPTSTAALAQQIRIIAERGRSGLYHATCQGSCSWNEFAAAIFEETKAEVELLPATSEDFPSPVRRPGYSVLDNSELREQGLDVMPEWREDLRSYLRASAQVAPSE
jgi:dTDP-4-dehydrorhamnose reductase